MLGLITYYLIFFSIAFIPHLYNRIKHGIKFYGDDVGAMLLFAGIMSLLSMAVVSGIDGTDVIENYETETRIYSLYNSDDIEGSVFLLVGSVNEDDYYTYLKKNDYGNYIKKRIEEEYNGKVEINTYDPEKEPSMFPHIQRYVHREANEGFWTINYDIRDTKRTVIHIPEGSLKRQIQIK